MSDLITKKSEYENRLSTVFRNLEKAEENLAVLRNEQAALQNILQEIEYKMLESFKSKTGDPLLFVVDDICVFLKLAGLQDIINNFREISPEISGEEFSLLAAANDFEELGIFNLLHQKRFQFHWTILHHGLYADSVMQECDVWRCSQTVALTLQFLHDRGIEALDAIILHKSIVLGELIFFEAKELKITFSLDAYACAPIVKKLIEVKTNFLHFLQTNKRKDANALKHSKENQNTHNCSGCASCLYQSSVVKHITYPKRPSMVPGEKIASIWYLKNDGHKKWPNGTTLVCTGGKLGGNMYIPVKEADAGEVVEVVIPLTAPRTKGNHSTSFRLCHPSGLRFGVTFGVEINVDT